MLLDVINDILWAAGKKQSLRFVQTEALFAISRGSVYEK